MSTTYVDSDFTHSVSHSQRSSTATTKRFRDSTHLVPSPGEFKLAKRYRPWALSLPAIIITPLIMFACGVGLEVAISISQRDGGFPVPARNVFQIASTQFLLSFFPTIFVYPLGLVWRDLDWNIRLYQPYVMLSRGNAKAEESLLLDYIALGPGLSLLYAMKFKHQLIVWSTFTALLTYILQPLAGTVLQVQDRPQFEPATANTTKVLGLDPDFTSLTAFAAAAGFAEAAVFNNLTDPPFIDGKWAIAEFEFPTYAGFNGSMTINTTSIKTDVGCDNPSGTPAVNFNNNGTLLLSATSQQGCTLNLTIDTTIADQQYGVNATGCGSTSDLQFGIAQQGVMFWFYHLKADNTPEARVVFCNPTIEVFDVTASANLASGALTAVNPIDTYPTENNITGFPLNSHPFNGVVFNTSDQNPFVQARATAANIGLPGAILRFASQQYNGLQSVFDDPNGFLDLTYTVYTQHLALVAKSIYFVASTAHSPAIKESFLPRLWINPLPGHAIALIMIFVGFAGILVTILNYRQRRKLLLATQPGSIASAVSLTAHSGFGELLLPYDNEDAIERKLRNLRFRLDRRTGAIVATEWNQAAEEDVAYGKGDETMMSLLGNRTSFAPSGDWAYVASPQDNMNAGGGLSQSSTFVASTAQHQPSTNAPRSRSSSFLASSSQSPKKISPSSSLSPTTAIGPVPRSPGPHITFSDAA